MSNARPTITNDNNEIELNTISSSGVTSDELDMHEITREELISSFINATIAKPLTYNDATHYGSRTFGLAGLIAGCVIGGPLAGIGGLITGHVVGSVIGSGIKLGYDVIKGGYDGAVKGGFSGAIRGMNESFEDSCKHLITSSYMTESEKEEKIKHEAFVAKFVTPVEYKDTLDACINVGGTTGMFLSIFGGPNFMATNSAAFGLCGSVIAGAIKGGYDGLVEGGFQGFISGSSFSGFVYGAAVGYYHYQSQYNSKSTYETPAHKIYHEASDSALCAAIDIWNYIADAAYAALFKYEVIDAEAYKSLTLFSASTTNKKSGKLEYFIAENPERKDVSEVKSNTISI